MDRSQLENIYLELQDDIYNLGYELGREYTGNIPDIVWSVGDASDASTDIRTLDKAIDTILALPGIQEELYNALYEYVPESRAASEIAEIMVNEEDRDVDVSEIIEYMDDAGVTSDLVSEGILGVLNGLKAQLGEY